jgi:hypothetical protein
MNVLLLLPLCLASVVVFNPPQLRDKFAQKYPNRAIPASLGNFGNPPYGTSLVGTLFRPSSVSEQDGCSVLTPIPFNQDDPDHNSSPILLLDRGTCAFVIKVRHAEDIGARLVLIVNNQDTNIDSIIMTDNGLGGNLKIPAFLISKEDGQTLKDALENSEYKNHINLAVTFDIKKSNEKIKAWVYTSPTSVEGRKLMSELGPYIEKFSIDQLDFNHHFVLWYCPECAAGGYKSDNKDCISGGRYCFLDPDEGNDEINGRNVMMEDLRLMCLFNLTTKHSYTKYFQYQTRYDKKCVGDLLYSEKCSKEIIEDLGVKYQALEKCVRASFEGENYIMDDNHVMKLEKDHIIENFIPFAPAIVINDQLYKGDLEADAIYKAFCAAYGWGKEPDFCKDSKDKDDKDEKKSGTNTALIIIAVIVLILLIIAILVVYRAIVKKDLNRDMKLQVNTAVAQYFQLAETPSRY